MRRDFDQAFALAKEITPYELYLKFLYEYFRGELNRPDEIEDMYLPAGFKKLKYQEETVLETDTSIGL